METATQLDYTDQQTQTPSHSLEQESPQDPYSGLRKLVEASKTGLIEPIPHTNHFDRHIESHGQQAPHWIAWLKAI